MNDSPTWNTIDHPLLEQLALLGSQGEDGCDNARLSALLPALSDLEVREGLKRLIQRGYVAGNPIGSWQSTAPVRVVNLTVTAAGMDALSE